MELIQVSGQLETPNEASLFSGGVCYGASSRVNMVRERMPVRGPITSQGPQRACLWLKGPADSQNQDLESRRADLERVCEQLDWQVAIVFVVEEELFDQNTGQQFREMLLDARGDRFDVLLVWSLDHFIQDWDFTFYRMMVSLRSWNVRFYSYKEPFLDTAGPFADFLKPLFAWLARQESVPNTREVVEMELETAKGKRLPRLSVQGGPNPAIS